MNGFVLDEASFLMSSSWCNKSSSYGPVLCGFAGMPEVCMATAVLESSPCTYGVVKWLAVLYARMSRSSSWPRIEEGAAATGVSGTTRATSPCRQHPCLRGL
eukprot:4144633-Amphidinium_carterae.1